MTTAKVTLTSMLGHYVENACAMLHGTKAQHRGISKTKKENTQGDLLNDHVVVELKPYEVNASFGLHATS